jgi:hypothetical protein
MMCAVYADNYHLAIQSNVVFPWWSVTMRCPNNSRAASSLFFCQRPLRLSGNLSRTSFASKTNLNRVSFQHFGNLFSALFLARCQSHVYDFMLSHSADNCYQHNAEIKVVFAPRLESSRASFKL